MKKILLYVCVCISGWVISQDTIQISLVELEKITIENNLNLKINNAKYELSSALFYKSILRGFPTVGFSINNNQTDGVVQNVSGDFLYDVTKNSSWQGAFYKADWNIADLVFGSIVEKKYKNSSFLKTELMNIDINTEITSLFYQLAASQEKEQAIESFIKKNNEIIKQLDVQISAGLRLESELILAKVNLNTLKIKLENQKNNTRKLNISLLSELNLNMDNYIVTDIDFYNYNTATVIETTIPDIISNRKDLAKIDSDINALWWENFHSNYGFIFPKIQLSLNEGLYGPMNSSDLNNQSILITSLVWAVPLGDLFPVGKRKENKQKSLVKEFEKNKLLNIIEAEIKVILLDFESNQKTLKMANESVLSLKKVYEQSIIRQSVGTASQLELFYIEEKYLNALLIYIDSTTERHIIGIQKKSSLQLKLN